MIDFAAQNLLNDMSSGGTLRVVQYTYINGASAYNDQTLTGSATDSWQNNGMFINQKPFRNSEEFSYRSNTNTGTTWANNGGQGVSTGVVVADITGDDSTVSLSTFCAWQMKSDGCITDIRISSHPNTSTPFPNHDDEGWEEVLDWEKIGALQIVPLTEIEKSVEVDSVIRVNETWYVPRFSTRYLKVECKNDGAVGNQNYIEIRQLRGFS